MSAQKTAVLRFPGSNCDRDVFSALKQAGLRPEWLSYRDRFSPRDYRAILLPGGFSYGDYLRAGALAARSPAMEDVRAAVRQVVPILGICNGFQILCEAKLLPGALLGNSGRAFIDRSVSLRPRKKTGFWALAAPARQSSFAAELVSEGIAATARASAPARRPAESRSATGRAPAMRSAAVRSAEIRSAEIRSLAERSAARQAPALTLPIAHGEGRYFLDGDGLKELEERDQIWLTYEDNPNGSCRDIAGVTDRSGTTAGLMPHPERAVADWMGGEDGRLFFDKLKSA